MKAAPSVRKVRLVVVVIHLVFTLPLLVVLLRVFDTSWWVVLAALLVVIPSMALGMWLHSKAVKRLDL